VSADRTTVLRTLAEKAALDLDGAEAESILRWASEQTGGRLVVAASMQDAVVVSLASRVQPGIDVVFLDTGYHFAETIGMRDAVASSYPIRLLSVSPALSVSEQDAAYGKDLFASNPNLCCHIRKVAPFNSMLGMYDGWITGLRRDETEARAGAMPVEWDAKREMLKINPIVNWTDKQVEDYIVEHDILVNPLHAEGYASIGCAPCTARVLSGDNPRSGRWAGHGKDECGLHL
jgi:phosphoadenosine phosphosulfate reductase